LLGSAYSLYSGYHSYKVLSDFKEENDDDPSSPPVPEKYFNSMFTNEFFFPYAVLIQLCSAVTGAVMANPAGGLGMFSHIYWLHK